MLAGRFWAGPLYLFSLRELRWRTDGAAIHHQDDAPVLLPSAGVKAGTDTGRVPSAEAITGYCRAAGVRFLSRLFSFAQSRAETGARRAGKIPGRCAAWMHINFGQCWIDSAGRAAGVRVAQHHIIGTEAQQVRAPKSVPAEKYYRVKFRGRIYTWNLRDQHMADTLQALGRASKPAAGARPDPWCGRTTHTWVRRATDRALE